MKYSGPRKLLCELSKLSKLNALTFSDTERLQIPPRENWFQTFNMYAEYTQLQLTFLALHSWLDLHNIDFSVAFKPLF